MPLPFLADGAVASCGSLLVVAGAGKAYASARRTDGDDAIRRALRAPRAAWRLIQAGAAVIELAAGGTVLLITLTGGAVIGGPLTEATGGAVAVLGLTFCALLGYARYRYATGGCGCLGGRGKSTGTLTVREIARAGLLACGGLALCVAGAPEGRSAAGSPVTSPWLYVGFLGGVVILTLLSLATPPRLQDRRCHRPLWRPMRAAAREVADSGVFAAMAQSAGPFEGTPVHRRNGCDDEYWYRLRDGTGRVVLFSVSYRPNGGPAAVRAVLSDAPATEMAPPRADSDEYRTVSNR
ncbi:MAG TPA: hypothetical protein VI365_01420 [Trebonia sp.]